MIARWLPLLLLFSVCGCGGDKSPTPAAAASSTVSEEITEIVETYQQLPVQSRRIAPNIPLMGCRADFVDEVPGTEGPHAHGFIKVYMNEKAAEAFDSKSVPYPVGAVIVKEKLRKSDSTDNPAGAEHNGIGGMIKRPTGYDPRHGDWEYFYVDQSSPLQSGLINNCIDCHGNASDRDYVFGTWRKQ